MQLAGLAIVLAACSAPAAPPIENQGTQASSFAVSLERTACFGRCPTYTVVIDGDGTVRWTGTANVKVPGKQQSQIDLARVAELAAAIDRIGFFELDVHGDRKAADPRCHDDDQTTRCDFRDAVICSDTSHAIVVVTRAGKTHRVDNDHCVARPVAELEALIDKLAGTAAWI